MRGKILLVVGFGTGYVLGAKAGRQRYEQIARAAEKVWNSPTVKKQRHEVQQFVEEQGPKLVESAQGAASDAFGKVSSKVTGKGADKGSDTSSGTASKRRGRRGGRGGHSTEIARPEDV